MMPSAPVILWCEMCNAAPAAGRLEILRTDAVETEFINVCNDCVMSLTEEDWI